MKTTAAIASVIALALASSPASAEKLILKFGHVGKPGSLFEASANEFARCANAALGDKAEVQTFGSSQLGKDKEMLQKLKLGQLTFSLPSSVMSSVADEFGVFEMPYIIKDRDHMRRVQAAMMDKVFQPAANAKGYEIIGLMENGFRHITNNVRPINKPEDLAGIKLRTPKGAWRVKMFKLYGANPTPMAFSEVFTALKTGVIDGQENPYSVINTFKLYDAGQKYLTDSGHFYDILVFAVSKKMMDAMSPEDQAAIREAGRLATEEQRKLAAKEDGENLEALRAAGMQITMLTPD